MTPKTQSVCKHCTDLDRQFAHLKPANTGAWQYRNEHGHWVTCETQQRTTKPPVAEPASTGEPPRDFIGLPPAPEMLYHTASGTAINMTEMRERINGPKKITPSAARPSEPSAPDSLCSDCGHIHPVYALTWAEKTGYRYRCGVPLGTYDYCECEKKPSAPQTSAELACQKCVEGIHGHCSGDCECRLSKCNLKVSAPQLDPRPDLDWPLDAIRKNQSAQPVSGDAPLPESPVKFKHNGFEHAVDRMAQGVIDSHPGSTLTAAYRAVALELYRAGDAPKVEEIILRAVDKCNPSTDGERFCLYNIIETAINESRRYFPPASQTPKSVIEAATELLDAMETCHICHSYLILQEFPVHCEDCSSDCENHDGGECTPIYVLHAKLRKLLKLATPASTARTDAKRVENTFDKLADQGFFEDVEDWPQGSRDECMEILTELAQAEPPKEEKP